MNEKDSFPPFFRREILQNFYFFPISIEKNRVMVYYNLCIYKFYCRKADKEK